MFASRLGTQKLHYQRLPVLLSFHSNATRKMEKEVSPLISLIGSLKAYQNLDASNSCQVPQLFVSSEAVYESKNSAS